MQIQGNRIVFPTHAVEMNLEAGWSEEFSQGYLKAMAEHLDLQADEPTPREHARVLRECNNDGTWGIK